MPTTDDLKEAIGFLVETLEVTIAIVQETADEEDEGLADIVTALEAHKTILRSAGLLPAVPGVPGPFDEPAKDVPSIDEAIAHFSSTSSQEAQP